MSVQVVAIEEMAGPQIGFKTGRSAALAANMQTCNGRHAMQPAERDATGQRATRTRKHATDNNMQHATNHGQRVMLNAAKTGGTVQLAAGNVQHAASNGRCAATGPTLRRRQSPRTTRASRPTAVCCCVGPGPVLTDSDCRCGMPARDCPFAVPFQVCFIISRWRE